MKFKEFLYENNDSAKRKKIQKIIDNAPRMDNLIWQDILEWDSISNTLKHWDVNAYIEKTGDQDEAWDIDTFMDYLAKYKKEFEWARHNLDNVGYDPSGKYPN